MKQIFESKIIKSASIVLINVILTFMILFIALTKAGSYPIKENHMNLVHGVIRMVSAMDGFDKNAKNIDSDEMNVVSNSLEEDKILVDNDVSTSEPNGVRPKNESISSSGYTPTVSYSTMTNYASLTGVNIILNEGDDFNPISDLKIKAKDIDGTNLTDNVKVIYNNVNTNESGIYSVQVKVQLKDSTSLIQNFKVEVMKSPLKVSVTNVLLQNNEVNIDESIKLMFNVRSSKSSVTPVRANVNGKLYSIFKESEDKYTIELKGLNESKVDIVALNFIEMSDGSIIAVNKKMNLVVLKSLPKIEKVFQNILSETGNIFTKLTVSDTETVLQPNQPITAILYDENHQEIDQELFYSYQQIETEFDLPKNGTYYLKLFGYANRNYSSSYKWTQLYEEKLIVDSIDKTSLTGQNLTINEGDSLNLMTDLQLKATNEQGEDITSQILVEGVVDTKVPGTYEITASVIKTNGESLKKVFQVIVKPIKTEIQIKQFTVEGANSSVGDNATLNLIVNLSKDYVEIDRVVIDRQEYPVTKIQANINGDTSKYQIKIDTNQLKGNHIFELSKIILCNGEEITVQAQTESNILKLRVYQEPLQSLSLSDDKNDSAQSLENHVVLYNANTNQQIEVVGKQQNSEMIITGKIANSKGELPEQITVTMPTIAAFTVSQDGIFSAPNNMTIENKSNVGITVSINSFQDTTPSAGAGITVVDYDILTGSNSDKYDRSHVGLKLAAQTLNGEARVPLTTSMTKTKLVDIDAQDNAPLVLQGSVGTGDSTNPATVNKFNGDVDKDGASDTFNLIFSITRK